MVQDNSPSWPCHSGVRTPGCHQGAHRRDPSCHVVVGVWVVICDPSQARVAWTSTCLPPPAPWDCSGVPPSPATVKEQRLHVAQKCTPICSSGDPLPMAEGMNKPWLKSLYKSEWILKGRLLTERMNSECECKGSKNTHVKARYQESCRTVWSVKLNIKEL